MSIHCFVIKSYSVWHIPMFLMKSSAFLPPNIIGVLKSIDAVIISSFT